MNIPYYINDILPDWFNNLALAGLALAPVTVMIVQIIKAIGARLGLLEGYGGYITLAVSAMMVIVALTAGFFGVEEQAADKILLIQHFAETMLTLLSALGWYSVVKKAQIVRPIAWSNVADEG